MLDRRKDVSRAEPPLAITAATFPYSGFNYPYGVAIDPVDASFALVANFSGNDIGSVNEYNSNNRNNNMCCLANIN